MATKTEYRCPKCGSDAVYFDAYASMNDPDDVQLFDDKVCQACGEHFDEAVEVEVHEEFQPTKENEDEDG